MESIFKTKSILKGIVFINICFILGLLFSAIFGRVITTGQSDAAVVLFLISAVCTIYRWVVLENVI